MMPSLILRDDRSLSFDPFLDLSVPIPKNMERQAASTSFLGRQTHPGPSCTLAECMESFTGRLRFLILRLLHSLSANYYRGCHWLASQHLKT
jgi:hypothetical protein